jgi:cystathionine beta-lyase
MKYNFDEFIERRNTNCYKYDFVTEYFGTDDLIPMWVADMDFRTPDFIIESIRERIHHELLGYTLRPASFYESIINWCRKQHDWTVEKDWIQFSPGVVPSLSMAVRAFTGEGEKVIVQTPVYHPFFSVIRENRRVPLYNPLREENGIWKMDLDDLRSKIDGNVKLILLSHPHNPVGRVWAGDELAELASICLENDILILSDEIHSDLVFKPNKHIPMSALSDEIANIAITCIAPSKTFNTAGLASSVAVIPNGSLREKFGNEMSTGHLDMGNIFGAVALEAAYSKGSDWLEQLLDYLGENIKFLDHFVKSRLPGIRMSPPEATYLAWLDMRDLGLKGRHLRQFMVEKARVGCNDGPSFGQGGEGFQRLNFACPRSTLEQALVQIETAIRKFL